MNPSIFRNDRFLRTSGYNLVAWALLNSLLAAPAYLRAFGRPWPPWGAGLYTVLLISAGVLLMSINERRVAKLIGPCEDRSVFAAGKLWAPVLAVCTAGTVGALVSGYDQFIQPLWLAGVGIAYWIWGRRVGLRLYAGLGGLLLATGAGVLLLQNPVAGAVPSMAGLHLWVLSMGIAASAAGFEANRRYLWL